MLTLTNTEVLVHWEASIGDLIHALPVDANADGAASAEELRAAQHLISTYALSRLALGIDGQPVALDLLNQEIQMARGDSYLAFDLVGAVPTQLDHVTLNFSAFFDVDPAHRGLLRLDWLGRSDTAIFTATHQQQVFRAAGPDRGSQFLTFLREGVWHIWIGFDHILFLLALLLPAVMRRETGVWTPGPSLRRTAIETVKIVTAFSGAHTVTLTMAMLGWVQPPARWVESLIALSVILAALNNVRPMLSHRAWLLAFGFGLIHGFGFANVLSELGLQDQNLAVTLIAFNLGVEIGQLAIVAVFLPVAFALRRSWFYRVPVLQGGSMAIALVATVWMLERALAVTLWPF